MCSGLPGARDPAEDSMLVRSRCNAFPRAAAMPNGAPSIAKLSCTEPVTRLAPSPLERMGEEMLKQDTGPVLGLEKLFRTRGLECKAPPSCSAQLFGRACRPSRLAASASFATRAWKLRQSLLAMEMRGAACIHGLAEHVEGPWCLDLELCMCNDELPAAPAQHRGCLHSTAD